tara:strand:- start:257 stop:475 length:219 start_codon:yes stop_codon:yes gene_type:complete
VQVVVQLMVEVVVVVLEDIELLVMVPVLYREAHYLQVQVRILLQLVVGEPQMALEIQVLLLLDQVQIQYFQV